MVIYDDGCGFCRRCVEVLKALDRRGGQRYEGLSNEEALRETGIRAEEAERELKLAVGGEVYGGYDAIVEIVRTLPGGGLAGMVMGLGPMRRLGRKMYRAVAARRRCGQGAGERGRR